MPVVKDHWNTLTNIESHLRIKINPYGRLVLKKQPTFPSKANFTSDSLTQITTFLGGLSFQKSSTQLDQLEKQTHTPLTFEKLPGEILDLVISNLDHTSLRHTSEVSKKFYQLCRAKERHWRHLFAHDFGKENMLINKHNLTYYELYRDYYKLYQRMKTGKARVTFITGHVGTVYCVTYFNGRLVSGGRDNCIKIWDIESGECIDTKTWSEENPHLGHRNSVLRLNAYTDKMISCSSDGSAIIWSKAFEPVYHLRGHTDRVLGACQIGEYFVTSSNKSSIHLWGKEGAKIGLITPCTVPANTIVSYGAELAIASSDSIVRIYDIEKGKYVKEFDVCNQSSTCIYFDGKQVLVGGQDNRIHLWSVETGFCNNVYVGHKGLVRSIAVVHNLLFSGSYDGSIRLWDISSGHCLVEYMFSEPSWIMDLATYGSHVFSAGKDGIISHFHYGDGLHAFT